MARLLPFLAPSAPLVRRPMQVMRQDHLLHVCRIAVALCAIAVVAPAQAPNAHRSASWIANTWQTGPSFGAGIGDRDTFGAHARLAAGIQLDSEPPLGPTPSAVWWKLVSIEQDPSPDGPPDGRTGQPPAPPISSPENPVVGEPHLTPEMSTWVLFGTGLLAIAGFVAINRGPI